MKIGIIGAGSIGLLFASYLCKQHDVTIYCRTASQADLINRQCIRLNKRGSVEQLPIHAKVSTNIDQADLYIICVKQYNIKSLIPVLELLDKDTKLLFLQNGIGHLSELGHLSHKEIILGVVEHGAIKESETIVNHTGVGVTRIASYRGGVETIQTIKEELATTDFPFIMEANYKEMLENKLLVNACINPLTAILHIKNGELLTNPLYNQLFQQVFSEVAAVLEITDREEAFRYLQMVCKNTAKNESSMLRDIKLHRQTEIDGIVAPLIDIAKEKSVQIPFLQAAYDALTG